MTKPRYTLTTITTSDETLVELTKDIRGLGYKHEEIYRRGLEAIQEEVKNGNTH